MNPKLACVAAMAVAFLASSLPAHGGYYRGPSDPTPGGPGGPGPATPGGGGGGTGSGDGGTDLSRWQIWWEFNKDPLLQLKSAVHTGATPTGGDIFVGAGKRPEDALLKPSEADRRDVILPALVRVLEHTDNRDLVTACMVAIAKIGFDADGKPVLPLLAAHLREKDQEVRETAALALGLSGLPSAARDLLEILGNTPAGQKLTDRPKVDDRTRSFAAYGLGYHARQVRTLPVKTAAYEALKAALEDKDERSRDVKIAAINGMRLLELAPDGEAKEKLLLWRCLETLEKHFDLDLGKGWQTVQCHAATAIARLLGRGAGPERARYKTRFAEELSGKRTSDVQRSCALALGVLCQTSEVDAEDAPFSQALLKYYAAGKDQQARFFCLIALGRIGGERNKDALLKLLAESNDIERPWAALGLGLIAFQMRQNGTISAGGDKKIDEGLALALRKARIPELTAGVAIACGLAGTIEAAPEIHRLLDRYKNYDDVGGYLLLSLALMRDTSAHDRIVETIQKSSRRPELVRQAAVALALLGDKAAPGLLVRLLVEGGDTSLARAASLARALGFIGDRRVIPELLRLLEDPSLSSLSRAFVVAALGGIGDKDSLPFNAYVSVDLNYRATCETLTDRAAGILDIL